MRVEVLALSPDGKQEPREVEQFRGEGRVAARGFRHPHFVPGQLFLMDDDVVGFLWLPIGTFVVFSRVRGGRARRQRKVGRGGDPGDGRGRRRARGAGRRGRRDVTRGAVHPSTIVYTDTHEGAR